ncbi:hypothetical protein Lokhon_01507 [Limimaricola hongkongensis DSM 17492]|uniref:Uncharacterized protein n=2 Tax=Limimaricola hongkongensis TaxID=278132 RepID=A0A017HFY7_9RHOB|nr:hypothetical protein Lokhon_01507 [Limimaricola hongkongensis DSM 17492]
MMEIELRAEPARRAMAVGVLYGFGGLCVYTALAQTAQIGWSAALLGLGVAGLCAGEALRRATRRVLRLDDAGLRDSDGTVLAAWENIVAIERGSLSLKPTNGFTLRLARPAARAWRPGLWWRFGHRLGVGGVTSARATKAMAQAIEIRLADRAAPIP